ncbi:MAG: 2,3-bisphosphoglycerate-independent phosphoglycerate mutase [Chloroflexota bacterium]|nr:2,3-bisphosphoglycerate-independent phosphoglycerate mutase [Chloroflexota bacterium]
MIDFPYIADICRQTPSKIVMLVVDGLGGLADIKTGKSELDVARLPNLDLLASQSECGLTDPVSSGITPGSGPGHMALFGYDPVKYLLGRGVLEALGIGINLDHGDVAARGNLATVDQDDLLVDRRAGRISTSESAPIIESLRQIEVAGVELSVLPVKDYRFVLVIKGEGIGSAVTETDPQQLGAVSLDPIGKDGPSIKTAQVVREFISKSKDILRNRDTANSVLLRGFSTLPDLPSFGETYNLNPAAVAAYPMYRGLAKVVGMKVLKTGQSFSEQLGTLREQFENNDFFFLHYKPADAAGEDGDFDAKVESLELLDSLVPILSDLNPDVLIVAGDHSSPAVIGGHSWHPVPLLIRSNFTSGGEGTVGFSEKYCRSDSLGRIPATSVMMLALAHAGKLVKFGP